MIEVIAAKSGDRTLSYNGKLLASSVDPRLEANKWVEKNKFKLKGIKSAIVIGAGAAYHLALLQKAYPHLKIICIEFNKDIIKQVRSSIEISLLGVDIIHCEKVSELFVHPEIQKALASSYKVIVHPSSQVHSAKFTNEASLQLNGRLKAGLQQVLQARGVDEDVEVPHHKESQLYSIVDVEPILLEQSNYDPRVVKACMELLK